MADLPDVERDLSVLATALRRLEGEYNMFFAGRLPRPPWETRARVEGLIRRIEKVHIEALVPRFQFTSLQARFTTLADLWDRGLRAREEGRPGPFFLQRRPAIADPHAPHVERTVRVVAFEDPLRELDKLRELYESLMDARREAGEGIVAFHRFADLVKDQVKRLRRPAAPEVAFRVAVRDGKVRLTARALKGAAPQQKT